MEGIEIKISPDIRVECVLRDAFYKYREGEKKYGPLDRSTDPRNFLKEAEAELLDAIVYMAFEVLRLRDLDARLNETLRRMPLIEDLPEIGEEDKKEAAPCDPHVDET